MTEVSQLFGWIQDCSVLMDQTDTWMREDVVGQSLGRKEAHDARQCQSIAAVDRYVRFGTHGCVGCAAGSLPARPVAGLDGSPGVA